MAALLLEDGTIESDLSEVVRQIEPLGIYFKQYYPGTSLLFPQLLTQHI